MERLTERTEHGYRLTPEQLPAAAERLGRWEDLALQLEASIRKAEEELAERDILRREYIDAIKSTLCGHLDNTYIVDMAGHKHPLKKKTEAKPENVIPFPKKP